MYNVTGIDEVCHIPLNQKRDDVTNLGGARQRLEISLLQCFNVLVCLVLTALLHSFMVPQKFLISETSATVYTVLSDVVTSRKIYECFTEHFFYCSKSNFTSDSSRYFR